MMLEGPYIEYSNQGPVPGMHLFDLGLVSAI
jgi:hypothetical protein